MKAFKAASKAASRASQKTLEKLGRAEGTVDIAMDQEKQRFFEAYEGIKQLSADANQLMVVMKQLSVQQTTVANDIHALFPSEDPFYNSALKLQDSTRFVDNAREQFESQMHEDMLEPIAVYLGQYKEMKHRIECYETRRVDKDRYARDVRKAQEKGKYAELPHAEEKLRAAKANYQALHDELMIDLPKMAEDRSKFFPLIVATYTVAVTEYFRSSAKAMAETRAMIDSLDRAAVHGYLPVITPLEDSSVKNFISAGVSGEGGGAADDADGGGASSSSSAAPAAAAAAAPAAAAAAPAPKPAAEAPPSKPAPAPKPAGPTATANFDFEADESNELSFKKGDVLTIVTPLPTTEEWVDAKHPDGRTGLVPTNYLTMPQ